MPPILWVFFTLQVMGQGHTLLTQHHTTEPSTKTFVSQQEYRVRMAKASDPRRICSGTTNAMATRNTLTRLQVDGVEQVLDDSWNFDWALERSGEQRVEYVFLDARSGDPVACHETHIRCDNTEHLHMHVSQCGVAEAPVKKEDTGDPRMVVKHPHFVMPYHRGMYMWGEATLTVKVEGKINERWYCPEVIVRWSDKTESKHEGDCEPFGTAEMPLHSWDFSHRLHCGRNLIEVYMLKAGEQIAGQSFGIEVRCF